MSIITDALKKAERSTKTQQVPPLVTEEQKPGLELEPVEKVTRKRKIAPFYVILIVISVSSLITSVAYYSLFKKSIDGYLGLSGKEAPPEASATQEPEEPLELAKLPAETPPANQVVAGLPPNRIASEVVTGYVTGPTLVDMRDSINLNGIMYSPTKPLAIINDTVMSEGDTVGNSRILKIGKDFVKFKSGDGEFTVKLRR